MIRKPKEYRMAKCSKPKTKSRSRKRRAAPAASKAGCKIVSINRKRRRICRRADGTIRSNTKA
jgi:hypothetical protein